MRIQRRYYNVFRTSKDMSREPFAPTNRNDVDKCKGPRIFEDIVKGPLNDEDKGM